MAPLQLPDASPQDLRIALQRKIAQLGERLRAQGRRVDVDVDQQTLDVKLEIDDFEPGRIRMPRAQVRFLIDAAGPRWTVLAGFHTESMVREVAEQLWLRTDDDQQVRLLEEEICDRIKDVFA